MLYMSYFSNWLCIFMFCGPSFDLFHNLHLYRAAFFWFFVWMHFSSHTARLLWHDSRFGQLSLVLECWFYRFVRRVSALVHEHVVRKAVVFSQRWLHIFLLQHLLVVECLGSRPVAFWPTNLLVIHMLLGFLLLRFLFWFMTLWAECSDLVELLDDSVEMFFRFRDRGQPCIAGWWSWRRTRDQMLVSNPCDKCESVRIEFWLPVLSEIWGARVSSLEMIHGVSQRIFPAIFPWCAKP